MGIAESKRNREVYGLPASERETSNAVIRDYAAARPGYPPELFSDADSFFRFGYGIGKTAEKAVSRLREFINSSDMRKAPAFPRDHIPRFSASAIPPVSDDKRAIGSHS